MLLLENTGAESVLIVRIKHSNSLLHNDRPMIKLFIHEMHSAAGNLDSISESLLLRLQSRKRRQQRRMNIENPPRKLLHKPGRKQTHVSGETDEVHLILPKRPDNFAVMLLPRRALRWNHHRIQSALSSSSDTRSVRTVRDNHDNARVRNAARINAVGNGHKVRAAPREKNA